MIYKMRHYAPDRFTVFEKDAFKNSIGTEIVVQADPLESVTGTVLSAEVSESGRYVYITLEIPDDSSIAKLLKQTVSGKLL